MEQTMEDWLNIAIPILMTVCLISTLVILWKFDIEIPVEKIDRFLQLFKRRQNGETCQLIKTEESPSGSVTFSHGSSDSQETSALSAGQPASSNPAYGAITKHTGAIPKHSGAMPKHIGAIPKHSGAMPKDMGAVPTYGSCG